MNCFFPLERTSKKRFFSKCFPNIWGGLMQETPQVWGGGEEAMNALKRKRLIGCLSASPSMGKGGTNESF